jgi:hypothetical protein
MNDLVINICKTGNLDELKKIVKKLLSKDIDEMINYMELELELIEKNIFYDYDYTNDYNICTNKLYYNILKNNINSCIVYLKKIK